jgi:hypothetical protein
VRQVGTDVLLDARLLLGKNLSFAHVGESSRRREREKGAASLSGQGRLMPARGPGALVFYGVDAAFMLFQRHGSGIHIV